MMLVKLSKPKVVCAVILSGWYIGGLLISRMGIPLQKLPYVTAGLNSRLWKVYLSPVILLS